MCPLDKTLGKSIVGYLEIIFQGLSRGVEEATNTLISVA